MWGGGMQMSRHRGGVRRQFKGRKGKTSLLGFGVRVGVLSRRMVFIKRTRWLMFSFP